MAMMELIDQETELKERLIQRIESTHNLGVLRGVLLLLEEIPKKHKWGIRLTPLLLSS